MYSYLNTIGPAIKVGALTLTAEFSGEMEPLDRVSSDEPFGVWTAAGRVFFTLNGREYSQDFCAAWFADETFDYWDDDEPLMSYDEESGHMREVTEDEYAAVTEAAGGTAAIYWAVSDARRAAAGAAKTDAFAFLDKCTQEGEA